MPAKREESAPTAAAAAAAAAEEQPISPLQSVVAGLGSTVISTIVSHPFEVVRSRQQAKELGKRRLLLAAGSGPGAREPSLLRSCASDLRELGAITREEGILGVYQGAGTHFVGHLLSGVVFFSMQAAVQRWLYNWDVAAGCRHPGLLHRVVRKTAASSIAGIVQVCATQPIWLVKNRQLLRHRQTLAQQERERRLARSWLGRCVLLVTGSSKKKNTMAVVAAKKGSSKSSRCTGVVATVARACQHWWDEQSITHDIVKIARKEGVRGLYSGVVPCMLMTVYQSIQYAAYDELKAGIVRLKHGRPLSTLDRVGASVVSRALALVISNPMTVLRTRLMQKDSPYRGLLHAATSIVREEGLGTFCKGTSAGLWKVVTAGLAMPCYDYVAERSKKFFA